MAWVVKLVLYNKGGQMSTLVERLGGYVELTASELLERKIQENLKKLTKELEKSVIENLCGEINGLRYALNLIRK